MSEDGGQRVDGGEGTDSGMRLDAGADAGPLSDGGANDAGNSNDAGSADSGTDAGNGTDSGAADAGSADAGSVDAGPADAGSFFVQIDISNTCVVSTTPASVSAPLNSKLYLEFYNHSVDYDADVWSSRTYGYLGLVTGTTWNDPIEHCGGPQPYTEYFDVNIAGGPTQGCPGWRFNINCQ